MKRIALMTSGGDAPGMNAHIRAVVRAALHHGLEIYGVENGFTGLIDGDFIKMDRKATANIISRGGTILRTARCKEFMNPGGRAAAAARMKENGIEGLIGCGGDGTFRGLHALWEEHKIQVIGTPGTIDNDLYGTFYTIGYDTAVNTATEAIDRIRDTADSHGRVFLIEVMGRHAGFIAMDVGIACGAEYIAVPETVTNMDMLYQRILKQGKKRRTIILVGEGDEEGGATEIAKKLHDLYDVDTKVTILGHIQRGGSPGVRDRVLASHLGVAAVDAILDGKTDIMIGRIHNEITYTPLLETWTKVKPLKSYFHELADILA
ncbi:MAG: 6-phosphofructokinase [Candidatus Kapabacteria bacterium]|nr:6-phosphofructokinase [Candidatus Kapabacteria bacterium]